MNVEFLQGEECSKCVRTLRLSKLGDFEVIIDFVHLSRYLSLLFSGFMCRQNWMSHQGSAWYPPVQMLEGQQLSQVLWDWCLLLWISAAVRRPLLEWLLGYSQSFFCKAGCLQISSANGPLMAHVTEIWLGFSFYPATAFIDSEMQKHSWVIKHQSWSCSITRTLPSVRYHGATRHVNWTLRMGKRQFGRVRAGKECVLQQILKSWGILKYLIINYKKLRIDTLKVKGGSDGKWDWKGKGLRSFRMLYGGSTLWGVCFKSDADMERF